MILVTSRAFDTPHESFRRRSDALLWSEVMENALRLASFDSNRSQPPTLRAQRGPIVGLTVHPSGDWIASTAEEENPVIRLWPLPPSDAFHHRPLPELLELLCARTNLRIIPDARASNGYCFVSAPFPGWK